ncbi:hypothetical protein PQQ51_28035 [Paraburkholderia xenovorans]|uniref:hypothetical protein n=1 Tax=Paraburkholderia xenovorans TaxID=36873 RepID=UPI0038BA95B0
MNFKFPRFDTPRSITRACILVPLLFGLYSVWLGADSNWDLYNYHLYNPFAWLHGKQSIDLAPAGMQSYFNPLMDVVLFTLNTHLPSRLVGFLLGTLHGLTFVLLVGIARHAFPDASETGRMRVPVLLAAAGCLTANFLSGLGNSMGDDTTALLVLAGVLVVLSNWKQLVRADGAALAVSVGSGVLVGLSAGLKLTNAIFAVALCLALLSYPAPLLARLRISFLFGIGVLAGIAITGGYWMVHMWNLYGNPLYPQFGGFFPNVLTQPGAAADSRWLPHGLYESLLWPFIITADSHRVGETPIRQIIWPIVYLAFIMAGVAWAKQRRSHATHPSLDPRQRLVVLFVGLGFIVWMKVFSIYRYLVAVEVLAPMAVWILLNYALPQQRHAKRVAITLLVVASGVVVTGGARTWGHEGWSDPLYHAEIPPLTEPDRTTVVIVSGTTAWGWVATQFPDSVAFTQLESSFPATDVFRGRILSLARERSGPVFGLINGTYNWRDDNVADVNRLVGRLGINEGPRGCAAMRWAVSRLRLHASVVDSSAANEQCRLTVRADDIRDTVSENRAIVGEAAPVFERNGFHLDEKSCVPYRSGIGKGVQIFQWCRLTIK